MGASKAGGSPDLPQGFVWPEKEGKALTFLLQIRLTDLAKFGAAEPLPREGLLSFFYEIEEQYWGGELAHKGGWRVAYWPSDVPLFRHQPPIQSLPSGRIRVFERLSLPDTDEPYFESLELSDLEQDAYYELVDTLFPGEVQHQILGHPSSVQSHVLWEYRQHIDSRTPRRLLLQLDSDETIDGMWGDAGMLYFLVSDDELRRKSFEDVWMIMQCS